MTDFEINYRLEKGVGEEEQEASATLFYPQIHAQILCPWAMCYTLFKTETIKDA